MSSGSDTYRPRDTRVFNNFIITLDKLGLLS